MLHHPHPDVQHYRAYARSIHAYHQAHRYANPNPVELPMCDIGLGIGCIVVKDYLDNVNGQLGR